MKSIYVGNLPYDVKEEAVRHLFEAFGTVASVKLISDRDTGRPRGFGFVEMADEEADAAAQGLDGKDFNGRNLRVNQARQRDHRGRGSGRSRRGPGHHLR